MRKMLVAALIVPVALLGAVRPAKAGDKAAAVLAGVVVGVGAALILDALMPRPVVAAPAVYQPAPPPVVYQPAPVLYQPAPIIVQTPPQIVYQTAPTVVYRPAPVIVKRPRHVVHAPHPVYVRDRHGRGYWADRYIPDR
ncbi:MAG: hypothetical protein ACHQ7H_09305 [Candidatus Rokuibacteriota bacterium]|jgi:hypothetical protein